MMQVARRFSRALMARPIRATATAVAQDVHEDFREERAAITTRPDTMPGDFFGAATAYLSDTLDSMNPYWQPEAHWAAAIDDNFGAQQERYFPQP